LATTPNTREPPNEACVCYCADCDEAFGIDTESRSWLRIECKSEDPEHIAYILKKPAGRYWPAKWWVRRELWLRKWVKTCSLMRSGERAGFYATLRIGLLVVNLAVAVYVIPMLTAHPGAIHVIQGATYGWWAYNVLDVLAVGTYATFVSRFPAHPLRTIVLTISNLIHIAAAYSLPYSLAAKAFSPELPRNLVAPLYFSCVTIATVGYGDFHPDTACWSLQLIVITEIFVGLFILAVLIAVVAGWINEPPTGPRRRPRFSELLQSGSVTPWPLPKDKEGSAPA